MGYVAALRSLFSESLRLGADIVVTLDADGQHNSAEIPSFIERIDEGDMFYGVPGFVTLCIAAFFWAITFSTFAVARTISTNVALNARIGTIVALMLMTTGIILWVLINIIRERA